MRSQTRQHFTIPGLVTRLVPSALRRRRDIREVEPEIVSPGDQKPWVLQLLAEGQLPGVNAEPLRRTVEMQQVLEDEQPVPQPILDEQAPVKVKAKPKRVARIAASKAESASAPIAAPPDRDSTPSAEEPAPPTVDAPALVAVEPQPEPQPEEKEKVEPAAPKPVRKRASTKHRPVKRAAPPQRAAAHAPAPTREVDAGEPPVEDVATVECVIRFWRGYRKANFFACVFNEHGEPLAVAESPLFRARGAGIPDKTDEAVAAYEALCKKLEDNGWQRAAAGKTWYADVYTQPA